MADSTTTASTEVISEVIKPNILTGRRRIVCAQQVITAENAPALLERSLLVHSLNSSDCNYLHNYFLGRQPVLNREKPVRPEIRNVVVENRAYQITKDRADALAGEPITYSAHANGNKHGEDAQPASDEMSHAVQHLNDCCDAADKHACDLEIVQWLCECGVAYRLVLPNPQLESEPDRPFLTYSLDPRCTFVVYSNDVYRRPLYAATAVKDELNGEIIHTMYTDNSVFTIIGGNVVSTAPNPLAAVPIVEYVANSERMGVFEAVLSLFDAINEVESNRVDGIAQFVQSLMVLENVDLDAEEFEQLLKLGCLEIKSTDDNKASVQLLTAELNQDQTQTLVDALYKTALSICGMPFNVGGSGSTSDTGAAVTMRDGWSNSESRCKETEIYFKRSERAFLALALKVMSTTEQGFALSPMNIEIKFTRRNYEAIQSKTQVLTTLLGSGKVHPRLAFEHCGMFADPEAAYDLSQSYVDEQAAKQVELFQQKSSAQNEGDDDNDGGTVSAAGNEDATPVNKA